MYLVTPDYFGGNYFSIVEESLKNGADILQYRDKTNDFSIRLETALRLKNIALDYDVPFIVNDDIGLAIKTEADGLHIGKGDVSYAESRRMLPEGIIGVSTYDDVGLAVRMENSGADYVSFGPFYETVSKKDAGLYDKSVLREAVSRLKIPVFAIGGIDISNIHELMESGISGVAVISAVFSSDDPGRSTRELRSIIFGYL